MGERGWKLRNALLETDQVDAHPEEGEEGKKGKGGSRGGSLEFSLP